MKNQKNTKANSKSVIWVCLGACAGIMAILLFFIFQGSFTPQNNAASSIVTQAPTSSPSPLASSASDLVILKSEISTKPKFYPTQVDGTKMEVIAVKASDGSIRTAFNTCQVCYSSGRGYYKVEGDTLQCQNCGNTFGFDEVEQQQGGCNPVPILQANKTDNDTQIVIPKDYLQQAKKIFAKWKTQS